jgi:hypothetical protein
MHSFDWEGRGEFDDIYTTDLRVTIHHNGDYSGDAIVTVQNIGVEPEKGKSLSGYPEREIKVPCAALIEFVGQHLACEMISTLEDLSGKELIDRLGKTV